MKLEVCENGIISLKEVYNQIKLVTDNNEIMLIQMRDGGFEFKYQDNWYFAKQGYLEPFNISQRGNVYVEQHHIEDCVNGCN